MARQKKENRMLNGDLVACAPPSKRASQKKKAEKEALKAAKALMKAAKLDEVAIFEDKEKTDENSVGEVAREDACDDNEDISMVDHNEKSDDSEGDDEDSEETKSQRKKDAKKGDKKEKSSLPSGVSVRLNGCWSKLEIEAAIEDLKYQLELHDAEMTKKFAGEEHDKAKMFSSPAKRKKRDRLRKLEQSLIDGTPIGGQLIPKVKGKKNRYAERSRLRQIERKTRAEQGVHGGSLASPSTGSGPDAPQTKICYNCGESGHELRQCKKESANAPAGVCYNCGKAGHALKNCSLPRSASNQLQFATCYICKEKGHLSSQCSQGQGMYPMGGGCHNCGSKYHLKRNCPDLLKHLR